MGVERAVTRWYAQRQLILDEIASIETRLRQLPPVEAEGAQPAVQAEQATLQLQLSAAQEKLRGMGDCPRPMMG
jgi:hypothetical protein